MTFSKRVLFLFVVLFFLISVTSCSNNDTSSAGSTAGSVADNIAPETTLDSTPANPTNEKDAKFVFSSTEENSTFVCKIDNSDSENCTSPKIYNGLTDGSHTFQVIATDKAGNSDATPAEYTWTIDSTAPEVTIDSSPANPTNSKDASFTFSSNESNSTFRCKIDNESWMSCTSPQTYGNLNEGEHTFYVEAKDLAGNSSYLSRYTWEIDITSPISSIDSTPPASSTSAGAEFEFSSNETGSTFECKLDTLSWESCYSPKTYLGLSNGSHTFQVRASDLAGNIETNPSSYQWTVNAADPETSINTHPDDPTKLKEATFTFSSNDTDLFECKLDSGSWADCVSPITYTNLSVDNHTFQVMAKLQGGQYDHTPASYTWTIDTVAPETTIDTNPDDPSNSSTATFSFSSNELNSTFQCKIDSNSWELCTSPKTYNSLGEGSHTFQVLATDEAGNSDVTSDSYTWSIDTVAPETTIDSSPETPTKSVSAALYFSSNESSTFRCKIDSNAWEDCTSPKMYAGLTEGSHTFQVLATDQAGNSDVTSASYTWIIDTTSPNTTINSYPEDPTNSPTATFEFSSNESNSTFECKIDSGSWVICTSPKIYSGLSDGSHYFEVRAIDEAGNTDPTPEPYSWDIDTAAPETTINSHPTDPANSTSATFSFSSESNTTFECKIDSNSWENCTSSKVYTGLSEGSHTFEVRAIDQVGNTDSSPALYTWVIDTTPPVTTISSYPEDPTTSTSATFVFSANESNSTFQCKLDSSSWEVCTSPVIYTRLSEGSHVFGVQATDEAGNVESPPILKTWSIEVSWKYISSGHLSSCGVYVDDHLYCWGDNGSGRLGVGDYSDRDIPTIVGSDEWKSVSAFYAHACGIKLDGTLWCWGNNSSGQLGNGEHGTGTLFDKVTPEQVGSNSDWKEVTIGMEFSCAINNSNMLYCWGRNNYGQLGIGSTTDAYTPQQVGSSANWDNIDAGAYHICGIQTNGTLWCWGHNNYGQLGQGNTTDSSSPVKVGTDTDWDIVSSGYYFECALKTGNSLYCWGRNDDGELGIGSYNNKYTPTQVGTSTNWTLISAGVGFACGENSGDLQCWGDNEKRQLGIETSEDNVNIPTTVKTIDLNMISAGDSHNCIIDSDNNLFCMGYNYEWELGIGENEYFYTPQEISYSKSVSHFSSGGRSSCLIDSDNHLYCFGESKDGKLGLGANTKAYYNTPQEVDNSNTWKDLSLNLKHSCGIQTDGSLYCWGDNSNYQLGIGSSTSQSSPVLVGDGTENWFDISTGSSHSCAIKGTGELNCWGYNNRHQVNSSSSTYIATPAKVNDDLDWASVTSGVYHNCAIKSNGELYCWGYNSYGQLGLGTSSTYENITIVGTDTDWSIVSAGGYHSCGIKENGTLWCWGDNNKGQLGLGSSGGSHYSPEQVGSDTNWVKISSGYRYSCAIKSDNTLYCWGSNQYGRLGDGSSTDSSTPVQVQGSWTDVSCGVGDYLVDDNTCATDVSGKEYCWGNDKMGVLGLEEHPWRLIPQEITP